MISDEESKAFHDAARRQADARAAELLAALGGEPTEAVRQAAARAARVLSNANLDALIGAIREATGAEADANDPLLYTEDVAQVLGIQPKSWRSAVGRGLAPAADDPDDETPVNRRRPRWRESTVAEYRLQHPGRVRTAKDTEGEGGTR